MTDPVRVHVSVDALSNNDPIPVGPPPTTPIEQPHEPRGFFEKIGAALEKPFEKKAEPAPVESPPAPPDVTQHDAEPLVRVPTNPVTPSSGPDNVTVGAHSIGGFYPPPPGVDADDDSHEEPAPSAAMVTPELADDAPAAPIAVPTDATTAAAPAAFTPAAVPAPVGGAPLFIASKDGVQDVRAGQASALAMPADAVRADPAQPKADVPKADVPKADLPIEQPGTPDPAHPSEPPTTKDKIIAAIAPLHTHRVANSGAIISILAAAAHVGARIFVALRPHSPLAFVVSELDQEFVMPAAFAGTGLAFVGKSPADVRRLK